VSDGAIAVGFSERKYQKNENYSKVYYRISVQAEKNPVQYRIKKYERKT
jgi:hypothetical protein